MNELFDTPESKSPRLLWMEKHGVWIFEFNHHYEATASGMTGKGQTEDAAIVDLARRMGIPLWNDAKIITT